MRKRLKVIILGMSALLLLLPAPGRAVPTELSETTAVERTGAAAAEQVTAAPAEPSKGDPKELNKGLDEQVQEIKTDVLSIAAQLNQLEEKLIYPSDTQIAIFVSVAEGEKFRLDSVEISLDGAPVAHHLYTFRELEALQKGGVQRIYTGNVRTGGHALQVTVLGKSEGGTDFRSSESFTVAKGVGPKQVGFVLAANGSKNITLKDW